MPSTTRLVRGVDEAVTGRSAAPSAVRQSVAASSDQAGRELEEQLLLEMKYAQEIKNKQAEKATEAAPEPEQPKLSPLEDGVYRDDSGSIFFVENGKLIPPEEKTFFHATTSEFERFDRNAESKFEYGDGRNSGGIFFSQRPDDAEYVLESSRGGYSSGSNIRPSRLDLGNDIVFMRDVEPNIGIKSVAQQARILQKLEDSGATSVVFDNGEVVVFSPDQVSSIFSPKSKPQGTTLRDRVDSLMSTFPKEPVFPKPLPPSTKKESTLRERVDKLASDISWEEARNSAPIEEIALTKAEFIFFEDMKSFDRESWRQLKEAVPSIEVEDNKLRLNLADIQAFDEYIKEEELLQYMRRGEGPNPFYSPPLNQAPSIPPRLIDERFQDDLLFGTRREDPNLTDELTRSGRRRRRSPEDKARIKRGDFYSFVGPTGAAGLTGTEYVDKVSSDVVLDVNGVPKFELDDSDARIRPEFLERPTTHGWSVSMGSILDHPALFKAYPELEFIPVEMNSNMTAAAATVTNPRLKRVLKFEINPTQTNGEQELLESIMHEVQHYIQTVEGFEEGAGTIQELGRMALDFDGWIENWNSYILKTQKIKANQDLSSTEIEDAVRRLQESDSKEGKAYQLYMRARQKYLDNPGETESRLVEDRLRMTKEERLANPVLK